MPLDTRTTDVPPGPPPGALVMDAAFSYATAALLHAAVKLRVPDALGAETLPLEELAQRCGAHAPSLFRALRVLEMKGFVQRDASGAYALTAAGSLLRSDVPGSMAKLVAWSCDPFHLETFAAVGETLVHGGVTFDRKYGEPFFQWIHRPENADECRVFNEAMTSLSAMSGPAIVEAYDFSRFRSVTDVGGGHGALLCTVLGAHPELKGAVADMPSVAEGAKSAIAAAGLGDRCEAHACDFFAAVPQGSDCYLMKHILHDWNDELALKILRNIRAAIPEDGTLLIVDAVLHEGPGQDFAKMLDIEMLVMAGGRERTEGEFRELLAQAGFALTRIVPTRSPASILEAKPNGSE